MRLMIVGPIGEISIEVTRGFVPDRILECFVNGQSKYQLRGNIVQEWKIIFQGEINNFITCCIPK
jgi:hypothetical protein